MSEHEKLNNLQCLRAIACLSVVLFHLAGALSASGYENFANDYFLNLGASGVDVFFVISGFVMVYIQLNRKTKPLRFIQNRIVRVAPLYWVLTLTMAMVLLLIPGAFATNQFATDRLVSSMLFFCELVLHKETLVFPGWTIEYEVLFYSVFFFSLYLRNIWHSILATSISLVSFVAFDLISSIVLEFIFGMVVGAIFFTRLFPKRLYVAAAGFGTLCLFATGVFDVGSFNRVLVWGIPSGFIVFGFAGMKQSKSNILTTLGDSSYSIYLAQAFLIPVFLKLLDRVWPSVPYGFLIIGGFAFVTVFGYMCFYVVERNLTRFSARAIGRRAAIA